MASASMLSRTAAPAAAPRCVERRVAAAAMRLPALGCLPSAAALSASLSSRTAARGAALQCRAPAPAAAGRGRLVVVGGSMEAGCGLLANKAGMTSFFTPEGLQVPVTVIALMPGNIVTQVKTEATDGYSAVQVGYNQSNVPGKVNKPEMGHLAKSGAPPLRTLQEFRLKDTSKFTVGQQLNPEEMFKAGDLVDVQGTSIGKGFQGGTKRHGFARGLMTHGSKSHRAPGSIGGNTAGRVYKFQRMPGQMGNATVKVRKLEVVRVSKDCLLVKGSVPGKPGNVLRVTPAKIVGKNI